MQIIDFFLLILSLLYRIFQKIDFVIKSLLKKKLPQGVTVISVGNLSLGGTGKTPFVIFLCELLKNQKPVVLSRGYKRKNKEKMLLPDKDILYGGKYGDEPELIVREAKVPVVVHSNRYKGLKLSQNFGNLFILDDGFQHYQIERSVDILLLDVSIPLSHYRIFPLGRLREPFSAVRRADIIVLTRFEDMKHETFEWLNKKLSENNINPDRIFKVFTVVNGIKDSQGRFVEIQNFQNKPVVAFAGIGNFDSFKNKVLKLFKNNTNINFLNFSDHHNYFESEIRKLKEYSDNGYLLLTTEKDAVKLYSLKPFVLSISIKIDDEKRFKDTLWNYIKFK